jgi:hypothetical protein
MLYQLSHVRMPVPSRPGPVHRIAPALRQNCIRSWPNHQLGTEAKAKNLSLERTRATPPPPLPQVSRPTSVPPAPARRRESPRRPGRGSGGGAPISSPGTRASAREAGGTQGGRPPCGDLGEVPIPGTWGRSPYRGPGGGPRGGTAMGEWPGGEARPPTRGRRGTRGMGGGGGPPWRGR